MSDGTIAILILDDHQVFAESLARLLGDADDLQIAGVATKTGDALDIVRERTVDVAIVDIEMPDHNGIDATAAIKRIDPSTQVIILSTHSGTKVMIDAVRAGCSGFVSKDRSSTELFDAIRTVASGGITLAPEQLAKLLPALHRADDVAEGELTNREYEVLELMATGLTNRAIGERLHLSENTIRNYVHRILTKLDVHSKLEAVAKARATGILHDY